MPDELWQLLQNPQSSAHGARHLGDALVRSGHAQARSVRARFQSMPQLKDWLEAWKTYEADNFDTQ